MPGLFSTSGKKKTAQYLEDVKTDYVKLQGVVGQLIRMMVSAQDDSYEFERLRRRAREIQGHPTFSEIDNTKLPTDEIYGKLQLICRNYARKRNIKEAADEFLDIVRGNLLIAPLVLKQIDQITREQDANWERKMVERQLGRMKATTGLATQFMDLDWMARIPKYKAVAVKYRWGADRPHNLDAMVGPTYERQRNRVRFPPRRFDRFCWPHVPSWDRVLSNYELTDLFTVTSMLPESFVDEVIRDHGKKRTKKR